MAQVARGHILSRSHALPPDTMPERGNDDAPSFFFPPWKKSTPANPGTFARPLRLGRSR